MQVLGKRVMVRFPGERTAPGGRIVIPEASRTQQHRLRVAFVAHIGAEVPTERGYELGDEVLVASFSQELAWDGDQGSEESLWLVQHDDVAAVLRRRAQVEAETSRLEEVASGLAAIGGVGALV